MKKINLVVLLSLLIAACGGSDDPGDPFGDVPSSEIVAVEQRDAVLSGVAESGRSEQNYKWWQQDVSRITYSAACEEEDEDITVGGYLAFVSGGDLRSSTSGSDEGSSVGTWRWASDAKDAIVIPSLSEDVQFVIRGLNESQVIYASNQSFGPCSVISWERFVR